MPISEEAQGVYSISIVYPSIMQLKKIFLPEDPMQRDDTWEVRSTETTAVVRVPPQLCTARQSNWGLGKGQPGPNSHNRTEDDWS